VLLSTPSPVVVNVSADWETWGTVIVAVLVVALFGFGIVRNILRRRKKRRSPDPDADGGASDEPDPNAPLAVQPTGDEPAPDAVTGPDRAGAPRE
jgi:flagellar biosynthesis/type III secretory pathway M-ring protein FliF/YscJ